jgi:hypothetical protein
MRLPVVVRERTVTEGLNSPQAVSRRTAPVGVVKGRPPSAWPTNPVRCRNRLLLARGRAVGPHPTTISPQLVRPRRDVDEVVVGGFLGFAAVVKAHVAESGLVVDVQLMRSRSAVTAVSLHRLSHSLVALTDQEHAQNARRVPQAEVGASADDHAAVQRCLVEELFDPPPASSFGPAGAAASTPRGWSPLPAGPVAGSGRPGPPLCRNAPPLWVRARARPPSCR